MPSEKDCIFCKIVSGAVPSTKLLDGEDIVAFEDIAPAAPFHALVVPRRHIATLNDLGGDDRGLIGEMVLAGQALAEKAGIAESGYRLIMNCNADGGQIVFHIHMHVLGGRPLGGLVAE